MSIAGIYSISGSFYKSSNEAAGGQIDLLIDRSDNVINLFEIKFYSDFFTLTKAATDRLRALRSLFQSTTKTRKQLFWIMLTSFCLEKNEHALDMISHTLTMDDLFD